MRHFKILIVLLCASATRLSAQQLYPFEEGSKWGYVSTSGGMVITTQYKAAGRFSEGLAAVRTNGTYGYIDASGHAAIPQQYDFAMPFHNGLALVFSNGRPLLVDTRGKERLRGSYATMAPAGEEYYWRVSTVSRREGIVNDDGRLVVDTMYRHIHQFVMGRALVEEYLPGKDTGAARYAQQRMGVIDTSGQWIIPFGNWYRLTALKRGYYMASPAKGDAWCLLARDGKKLFGSASEPWTMDPEDFSPEGSVVNFYLRDGDELKKKLVDDRYKYSGVIDTFGHLVFSNPAYNSITSFSCNRALAELSRNQYALINRKGERVSDIIITKGIYDQTGSPPLFTNGRALVMIGDSIAEIDTTGHFIQKPTRPNYNITDYTKSGPLLKTIEDISTKDKNYSYRYGLWDPAHNLELPPSFYNIRPPEPGDSLISVLTEAELPAYINLQGRIVWQGKKEATSSGLLPLNIDYMNRGYFYVPQESMDGSTDRIPATPDREPLVPGSLQILTGPADGGWARKFQALTVYLINGTNDTACFGTQDSRLYMNVQAKNTAGEWQDIEYLPSSWCGNSYYSLCLPPGRHWAIKAPVYVGSMRTTMRIKLVVGGRHATDQTIYSSEMPISINPGQFWRREGHIPQGLMDPYND